jgi:hypothetical protein
MKRHRKSPDSGDISVGIDIEIVKDAIYWRGVFVTRYAAVEFAIAELVSRSFLHEAYNHLGQPPFGPAKKLKMLNQMIELPGPLNPYRSSLRPRLGEFAQYMDGYRGFMVHAIMVPRSTKDIAFQMHDHREGVYSVGELRLELEHLEKLAMLIGDISIEFTSLVAKICAEIPLQEI